MYIQVSTFPSMSHHCESSERYFTCANVPRYLLKRVDGVFFSACLGTSLKTKIDTIANITWGVILLLLLLLSLTWKYSCRVHSWMEGGDYVILYSMYLLERLGGNRCSNTGTERWSSERRQTQKSSPPTTRSPSCHFSIQPIRYFLRK